MLTLRWLQNFATISTLLLKLTWNLALANYFFNLIIRRQARPSIKLKKYFTGQ